MRSTYTFSKALFSSIIERDDLDVFKIVTGIFIPVTSIPPGLSTKSVDNLNISDAPPGISSLGLISLP